MQTKLSEFEATYSRVVLVLRASKQILFATPELATFVGTLSLDFSSIIGF